MQQFPVSMLTYVSRVLHMISIALLSGETISSLILGPREPSKASSVLYASAGIIAIVTGLLNWTILEPKKRMGPSKGSFWIGILHTKLLLTLILLTPAVQKLFGIDIPYSVKVIGCVFLVLAASFMRFFREDAQEKINKQS